MMLLPLYRQGEMTKEEFNKFFQGIPLSGEQPQAARAEEAVQPKPPDEPPSEILATLSKLFQIPHFLCLSLSGHFHSNSFYIDFQF